MDAPLQACADSLVEGRRLAATFDLATWNDPRDAASRLNSRVDG